MVEAMNPENLTAEALSLFNNMSPDAQREASSLAVSLSEDEAVYLAAFRAVEKDKRRQFLFCLSKNRWGL